MNPLRCARGVWAGMLAFGATSFLHAQTAAQPDSTASDTKLPEVLIQAVRTPAPARNIPQRVVLVPDSTIRLIPTQDLAELLRQTAGVDIIRYPGTLASVGIRGFAPQFPSLNQRTLLLQNGRPAGTTNLGTINPLLLQRVEVLKGPASALYGAQAMGGVVNVLLPTTVGPLQGAVLSEYGSFRTYRLGARLGGDLANGVDFDLLVDWQDRDADFRLGRNNWLRDALNFNTVVATEPDGTRSIRPDDRGDGSTRANATFSALSAYLRLGYRLAPDWRVDVSAEGFFGNGITDPGDLLFAGSANRKNIHRYNLESRLSGQVGRHALSGVLYYAREQEDYLADLADPYRSFRAQPQWYGVQLRDAVNLGVHRLTVGFDLTAARSRTQRWNRAGVPLPPFNPDYTTTTSALYAQGELSLLGNRLLLRPGLRYERLQFQTDAAAALETFLPNVNGRFVAGTRSTGFLSPSMGAVLRLSRNWDWVASVGRSFVTPDAFQVAGQSLQRDPQGRVNLTEGNPALTPENAWGWDGGVRFASNNGQWHAVANFFANNVRDRISTVTTSPNAPLPNGDTVVTRTSFVNARSADFYGLELSGNWVSAGAARGAGHVRVTANATHLLQAKEDIVQDGELLRREVLNVARWNATLGIEYRSRQRFSSRLTGRYVSRRYDLDFNAFPAPTIWYAPYTVFDLAVAQQFGRSQVTLLVGNLTDENYYEKYGFNLPGRSLNLRYVWQFGAH